MGGLGIQRIGPAALLLVAVLVVSLACESESPTSTAVSPESTASATVTPTHIVIPTPTPGPTLTPTSAPSPTIPSTPAPTVLPQTASLKLEVATPAEDAVVTAEFVTVAGLTSPDATVSVNGTLAPPDSQGHFSVDLPISFENNPLPIEVIATSLSGEQRSVIRTVIFVR